LGVLRTGSSLALAQNNLKNKYWPAQNREQGVFQSDSELLASQRHATARIFCPHAFIVHHQVPMTTQKIDR
jgi:hypothetical protein